MKSIAEHLHYCAVVKLGSMTAEDFDVSFGGKSPTGATNYLHLFGHRHGIVPSKSRRAVAASRLCIVVRLLRGWDHEWAAIGILGLSVCVSRCKRCRDQFQVFQVLHSFLHCYDRFLSKWLHVVSHDHDGCIGVAMAHNADVSCGLPVPWIH